MVWYDARSDLSLHDDMVEMDVGDLRSVNGDSPRRRDSQPKARTIRRTIVTAIEENSEEAVETNQESLMAKEGRTGVGINYGEG